MSHTDSTRPTALEERPDRGRSVAPVATRLLRAVVAVSLLYFIFGHIGASEIFRRVGTADFVLLPPAMAVFIFVHYIASVRLKYLTDAQGLSLSVPLVFEINLSARFYALFLPGGNMSALLIRIFRFMREGSGVERITTALFADRITATLSLCLLGILFWITSPFDWLWLAAVVAVLFACLVPATMMFFDTRSFASRWITAIVQRLAPKFWKKFLHAMHRSRRSGSRAMTRSLALSITAHLMDTGGYWLLARSLGLEITFWDVGWIRAGMMLTTLLPVSISGLGIREAASLVLLGFYGVPADAAIAFSLLVFITAIVGIGLLGGLTEAWRFVRR